MGSCESLEESPWDKMRHKGFIPTLDVKMITTRIFDYKTIDSNVTLISIWGNTTSF